MISANSARWLCVCNAYMAIGTATASKSAAMPSLTLRERNRMNSSCRIGFQPVPHCQIRTAWKPILRLSSDDLPALIDVPQSKFIADDALLRGGLFLVVADLFAVESDRINDDAVRRGAKSQRLARKWILRDLRQKFWAKLGQRFRPALVLAAKALGGQPGDSAANLGFAAAMGLESLMRCRHQHFRKPRRLGGFFAELKLPHRLLRFGQLQRFDELAPI